MKPKLIDFKYWFHDFVKITGIPALLYYRIKRYYITGKRPKGLTKGRVVVVANHNTMIDAVLVSCAIPSRRISYIAASELFDQKIGWFFRGIKCIRVDRKNVGFKMVKEAREVIDRGHALGVFPEGKVVRSEDVSFKSGAVFFAAITDAEIVPLYSPLRKKWWKRQIVVFGERFRIRDYLDPATATASDFERVTKILEDKMKELENFAEGIVGKNETRKKRDSKKTE